MLFGVALLVVVDGLDGGGAATGGGTMGADGDSVSEGSVVLANCVGVWIGCRGFRLLRASSMSGDMGGFCRWK